MSKRKQFSQSDFDANDPPANRVVLEYINSSGLYGVRNEDLYGPDIIVYNGFKPSYYVEVEVKQVWRTDQDVFPWSEINLPERKGKFLKLGLPIEFWILRSDLQVAVIIPGETISSSSLVEIPNRVISSGEKFYQVSLNECILLDLRGDNNGSVLGKEITKEME